MDSKSSLENVSNENEKQRSTERIFCYYKLFNMLREKKLKQQDLEKMAGVSSSSINKLTHNKNVNTEILEKICTALDCELADIVETRKRGEEK